jgi:mercuric ion transport protein
MVRMGSSSLRNSLAPARLQLPYRACGRKGRDRSGAPKRRASLPRRWSSFVPDDRGGASVTSPETTSERRGASWVAAISSGLVGAGAAATATAASLCCVGPAVISIIGVGGAAAAAGLKPYRPLLILGSLVLLGLGFWLSYRPATASSGVQACPTRAGRVSRGIVWTAAGVWLLAVLLPLLAGPRT